MSTASSCCQTLFSRSGCEDDEVERRSDAPMTGKEDAAPDADCPFEERSACRAITLYIMKKDLTETSRLLRLGTRASALALRQASEIKRGLESAGHTVLLEEITTLGDRVLDVPLSNAEGKSFFTRELDMALLEGRIDLAVHSLKDLPTAMPEGLVLAAVCERSAPFDAFVAHPRFAGSVDELPPGARIATSSLRRTALLKAWRPDLEVVPVRGNVDTRLARLDESEWHGMVLAAAGLIRLGLEDRIRTVLDPEWMLPAVGQGALGVVCVAGDAGMQRALETTLDHAATAVAVRSERAFLRRLEGGCQVPIGAWARHDPDEGLILDGCVASIDGGVVFRRRASVDPSRPEEAGIALAERLIAEGAAHLLQSVRS